MRIFYDWEFYEDGERIYPISLGMVTEEGEEFYLVNGDMPAYLIAGRPWLMENVVPHLPLIEWGGKGSGKLGLDHLAPELVSLGELAVQARIWIQRVPDPELWAWYGAYDHVCLAQLWGPMIDMPAGVPWFTNDIRTLALLAGPDAQAGQPLHRGRIHHALDDAKYDAALFEYYAPLVDVRRLA